MAYDLDRLPAGGGCSIPPEAIIDNYDSFLNEGMTPVEAVIETADCYPTAGVERIRQLLAYRDAHELAPQL